SQRREARRPPGAGADQVRARDQPQDRESTWPNNSAVRPCPRGRGDRMRRRDFIKTIAVSAATWPLAVHAEQPGKVSRVGYLGASSASLERRDLDAFRQTLRDLGHVEGENINIEFRWADGDDSRLPGLAFDLIQLKVDVIVTAGTPGTLAAKQATKTIPIVFASSGNPVGDGLVASYVRPGGNVTGFTI